MQQKIPGSRGGTGGSVVFIGAGNLAANLSVAVQNAGFKTVQVYSRSESSARALAGLLHTSHTTDIGRIAGNASLYIISVSDDAIAPLAERLAPALAGRLVVHTAGSVPADVFAGRFRNYGVMYPLQTFSKSRPVDFSAIPLFLEANTPENLHRISSMAGKISGRVYHATSAERMQLHLAAVFGCNFVNCLYEMSGRIARQAGFGFDVLSPLILETACKAIASGNPECVQTGPAIRGDTGVMQKHLEMLAGDPGLQKTYAQLSGEIRKKSEQSEN